ncbi:DUF1684 domain-containing protein [Tenacibaculum sp. 190130A14a]
MKKVAILFLLVFGLACNSAQKRKPKGETDFQKEMNAKFKDATTSPLTKKGLRKFKGLDFFPVNTKFKVKAKLVKTPDSPILNFPTTTERIVMYKKYGTVSFIIDGVTYELAIYKDEFPEKGYENHLFLPFLDKTNGETSYAGGRFIDVLTTDEKEGVLEIDFNHAYNPYCAYSDRYSCPITPRDNYLDIEIEAGVMAYKK